MQHAVLTLERAAYERVPDIVGETAADGAVIHHAAVGIVAAHTRARVHTLVPETLQDHEFMAKGRQGDKRERNKL